jgi:hypothetical protein
MAPTPHIHGRQDLINVPIDVALMRSLDPRAILIVVRLPGGGKATIATALAQRLGWPLQENELDPPGFGKTHSAGLAYARDQWSWLSKVASWIDGRRQLGTGGVITCSAPKRSYRDFLTWRRPQVRLRARGTVAEPTSMVCPPEKVFFGRPVFGGPIITSCRVEMPSMRSVRATALASQRYRPAAQEYEPKAQRHLGNFPQAFSHLGLIGAARSPHDTGPAQQRAQRAKAAS